MTKSATTTTTKSLAWLCITVALTTTPSTVSSFVSSPTPSTSFLSTSSSNPWVVVVQQQNQSIRTIDLTSLGAKPKTRSKKNIRVGGGGGGGGSAVDQDGKIPANLRRKVNAKRPPLGHVIPASSKQRGAGGSANPVLRPQGKAREAGMNNPSNLRIMAGTARGRRLDSPEVFLRPMMGKVREAVFSTFTSFGLYDSDSTRHLDIFSGSGSVGLESLSRGAAHCSFVDLSRDCCDAVERNLKWCNFEEEGKGAVYCGDAIRALSDPTSVGIPVHTPYQIVTLCPPYEEVVYADLLEAVANSPLVTDDTIILVEYPVELGCLPHVITRKDGGALVGVRNRKYGRTVIAMYIVNPTGNMEVAHSRPEEFVSI